MNWEGSGFRRSHSGRKGGIWICEDTSCAGLWLFRAPTWHIKLKARVRKQGLFSLLSWGSVVLLTVLAIPSPGVVLSLELWF